MFSEHPEPGGNASKKDAFDLIQVATSGTLVKIIPIILNKIVHLLFNLLGVRFQNVLVVNFRLFHINQ
jgi:hypothetical protein